MDGRAHAVVRFDLKEPAVDETIMIGNARLIVAFADLGYRIPDVPGVIDGTAVYDLEDRYVFAWHRRPHHLLFYLRNPALNARPGLPELAAAKHATERLNQNNGGETTIRLESDEEVRGLLSWLLPLLPFRQ